MSRRTSRLRVANSTPMVDLDSRQNSFLVKRESRLDLPTPEVADQNDFEVVIAAISIICEKA